MQPTEEFRLNLQGEKIEFKWKISIFDRLNKMEKRMFVKTDISASKYTTLVAVQKTNII